MGMTMFSHSASTIDSLIQRFTREAAGGQGDIRTPPGYSSPANREQSPRRAPSFFFSQERKKASVPLQTCLQTVILAWNLQISKLNKMQCRNRSTYMWEFNICNKGSISDERVDSSVKGVGTTGK